MELNLIRSARTRPQPTAGRAGDDSGAVTIFVVIVAGALLVFTGLVVDGAGKIRTLQRADQVAMEAARAAAQQIDTAEVVKGHPARVDTTAARAAARAYLSAAGFTGSVKFGHGNQQVSVTTRAAYDPVVLGIVGLGRQVVDGRAEVALIHQRNQ